MNLENHFNQIFHTVAEWHDSRYPKSGKAKYEGHFSVALYMGSGTSRLDWDIKREWAAEIKFDLSVLLDKDVQVVYGFAHNKITVQYLMKKDMEKVHEIILNKLKKFTNK